MRKLTTELYKINLTLFICFFTLFFLPFHLVKGYLQKTSIEEVKIVEQFLKLELLEPEHQNLEYFLEEILKESPLKNNMYIQVNYHGKIYSEGKIPNLSEVTDSSEIQILHNRYLYVLKTTLNTLNHGKVDVIIANDQDEEKAFIHRLFYSTVITALIFILLAAYALYLLKQRLSPQLKKLETIDKMTNLESFSLKYDKNQFYYEFSEFLTSYEGILKKLQQNYEIQSDFVNASSHELKTPIFIIQGYMSLLKKHGIKDLALFNEAVDTISDEMKSMNSLIDKLLFLSRGNKFPVTIENIDLTEIVEEVISEIKIIYPKQKITLYSKKIKLKSDWELLKLVIRNILDNAVKYGLQKPIDIYLLKRGEIVCISIKDLGYGISKEDLNKIFNKFYRVDKSRSREIYGHGLGLSIVKNILTILKGDIEYKSSVGQGTEVLIKIPLDYINYEKP